MPITGRAAGNPMLRKWYWACFSMATRRVCGVSRKIERATYEAVPFRFIAGNQHPEQDTLRTFRRTFLPELKDLFVQVLLLATSGGGAEIGDDQLGWDQDPCRCFPAQRSQLQATPGVGDAAASRDRGAVPPERPERPARHPRGVGGARRDGTARGPPSAEGCGQSGAASACQRAAGRRAGGVGDQAGAARGAGAHDRAPTWWPPADPAGARTPRRRPVQFYRPAVAPDRKIRRMPLLSKITTRRWPWIRGVCSSSDGPSLITPTTLKKPNPRSLPFHRRLACHRRRRWTPGILAPRRWPRVRSAASSRTSRRVVIPIIPAGNSDSHRCPLHRPKRRVPR